MPENKHHSQEDLALKSLNPATSLGVGVTFLLSASLAVVCLVLSQYATWDMAPLITESKKMLTTALPLSYRQTLMGVLFFLSLLPCVSAYLAIFNTTYFLKLLRKQVQKRDTKTIQSTMYALNEELAISSSHIVCTPKVSIDKNKTAALGPVEKNSVFLLSTLIGLAALGLCLTVSPTNIALKLIPCVIIWVFLMYVGFSEVARVNETLKSIKKDIIKNVKESSSPATQVCLFNQTNAHKIRAPSGLLFKASDCFEHVSIGCAICLLALSGLWLILFL